MSTPLVKTYFSYHEMMSDFAGLSDGMDFEKSLTDAPPMSFYMNDGRIVLATHFNHFLLRIREELGIKVNAQASEEQRGFYVVSFDDYAPVEKEELAKIQVKPVDSPAKKRAQRNTNPK